MTINDDNKKSPQQDTQSSHSPEEKLPKTVDQEQVPTTPEVRKVQEIDYKELFLLTNADLQNFKRRVERERTEWSALMQADVIIKIIPIIDNLERAVQTAEQKAPAESASWIEGFVLILKNFKKTLLDMGAEEIQATGPFNPEFHEALVQIESPNHPSGDIVEQFSKGYTFKGKVIKHAQVSVAK